MIYLYIYIYIFLYIYICIYIYIYIYLYIYIYIYGTKNVKTIYRAILIEKDKWRKSGFKRNIKILKFYKTVLKKFPLCKIKEKKATKLKTKLRTLLKLRDNQHRGILTTQSNIQNKDFCKNS